MRTIRPIYSENKLEADINTGKNGAIIFIGAVMAKCNSYVLNYICLASFPGISLVYVSKLFHSSSHVRYQSNLLISSLLAPTPLPLLYHCPVGRSDKNTINETEKKQEASRQVAAMQSHNWQDCISIYFEIIFVNFFICIFVMG